MRKTEHLALTCECDKPEHLAVLHRDTYEDGEQLVWLDFCLSPYLPFWQRLRAAARFVFRPSSLCQWDSVVLGAQTQADVAKFLEAK